MNHVWMMIIGLIRVTVGQLLDLPVCNQMNGWACEYLPLISATNQTVYISITSLLLLIIHRQ